MASPVDLGMRAIARTVIAARATLQVEGREHLPTDGPCLVVARHYHHLYDGAALVVAIPRPVRILVALDWVRGNPQRRAMESLCRLAHWPIVLRREAFETGASGPYGPRDRRRYLARALAECSAILRAGELLVVFPEGRPTVDPFAPTLDPLAHAVDPLTDPTGDRGSMPFRSGFAALASYALRSGRPVPIVPAGFVYALEGRARPSITLRFGAPIVLDDPRARRRVAATVEQRVRELSLRS